MTRKRSTRERLDSVLAGGATRCSRARSSDVEPGARAKGGTHRRRRRQSGGKTPNLLVTGVSRYWGERLAVYLECDDHFGAVHGVDVEKPRINFRRVAFTHLDIRSPLIIDFLLGREIDTVVHLMTLDGDDGDPETQFQRNVMDYMFLLSACAEAGVRNLVIKSETAVYGHQPDNPVAIPESRDLVKKDAHFLDRNLGIPPHLQNLVEIEKYTHRFCHDQAACHGEDAFKVVSLRFTPILGPRASTWLTRYLREPVIPTALGFDPLLQILHEDDVVRALYAAAVSDLDGPINVGASGVLTLHQIIRRAGKTSLPFAHFAGNLWRKLRANFTGEMIAPLGWRSLKYSCIGDLSRMREEFDFAPRRSADQTLDHFTEHRRMARYYQEQEPDAIYGKYTEEALKAILAENSLGMEDA